LIAREFAGLGVAGLAIHYNSNSSKAEADETVAAVEKAGAKAFAIQGD